MARTRQPTQDAGARETSEEGAAIGGVAAQNLLGNSAVAGLLPGLGIPRIGLPEFGLPEFGLPDIDLPSLPIPEIPLPSFDPIDLLPSVPEFPLFPQIPGIGPLLPGLPSFDQEEEEDSGPTIEQLLEREGMDALFDLEGARDRYAASEELASRFDIVADDYQGPRAGNQVTQAEYDRIVREYSEIRLGRTDLQIDTSGLSEADAAAFRDGTMSDIADIMQTESGRGLIGSLAHAPGHGPFGLLDTTTTISRRNGADGNADPSNATGGGTFGESGFVNYVPGTDTAPASANIRSDVTLYHELVHAHHAVYNTWNGNTVTAATGGTPTDVASGIREAEYQAAGLGQYANDAFTENRYRGERRLIGATGVGARSSGSETDANMSRRDTYAGWSGPGPNPATIPAAPGTAVPGVTPSAPAAGGAGDAGRLGQSTEHDHDHDPHHH